MTKFDRDNLYFEGSTDSSGAVSIETYGGLGNDNTDDLAALNLAIADLNSGTIKALYFPAGTYKLSAEPNALTANYATIFGEGTNTLIQKTAGTSGTFFTIGSADTSPFGITFRDLAFDCENTATLSGGYVFDLKRVSDITIQNINAGRSGENNGVAGFVKFGDAALGTMAINVKISNFHVRVHGPSEATVFDGQMGNVVRVNVGIVNVNSASVTGGVKSVYIHPAGTNGDGSLRTADSWMFNNVAFNFIDTENVNDIVVIDSSQGIVINFWFTDCVFDHSLSSAIKLVIDGAAHANARINNIYFNNIRSYIDDAGSFVIDNSGGRDMNNISFVGGVLTSQDEPAVRITGNVGKFVDIIFNGVNFVDSNTARQKPVIEAEGIYGLTITGCKPQTQLMSGTTAFTYLVEFTNDVESFVITNNDAQYIISELINFDNVTSKDISKRSVNGNITKFGQYLHKTTVIGDSATAIATIPLAERYASNVLVTIVGRQGNGAQRASYLVAGTFYREDGGTAVQQGSTTSVHAAESLSDWAGTLGVSGNDIVVNVTGTAASTIQWAVSAEIITVYN